MQVDKLRVRVNRSRKWNGCHRLGLGVFCEHLPMGTTLDYHKSNGKRRPYTAYNLTVEFLLWIFTANLSVWTD